ncbi:hypothetical protein pb186bvf_003526 [Paramecium bursaria]
MMRGFNSLNHFQLCEEMKKLDKQFKIYLNILELLRNKIE